MAISIIGHFGGKRNFNDGQTIKTRTFYSALNKTKVAKVHKVDTYYIKKNPFLFIYQLLRTLFADKRVVVLLSSNGRKFLFPILCFWSKRFKKFVYHYAIGGRLADEASDNERLRKRIASFKGNWLENKVNVTRLHEIGVKNAVYVPNFKSIKPVDLDSVPLITSAPFRFCLFSRVMKKKGVQDAADAIVEINRKSGKTVAELDIYGPIDEGYKDAFNQLLEQSPDYIQYKGIVPANESVDVLKDYFMLLFPTRWFREGMPGTVIDALFSALPVIASDWAFCREMLEDEKTALIYDFNQPSLLIDKIEFAMDHPMKINAMKGNCLDEAENYSEKKVMDFIIKEMYR